MGMSKRESGIIGGEKSKLITQQKKYDRIVEYNKNPKLCTNCSSVLEYDERNKKFCSSSCSALFNNKKRKVEQHCLYCDKILVKKQKKFCSNKCQHAHNFRLRVESDDFGTGKVLKKYVISVFGYSCNICGIFEWNGKDIVLELEHKDGNSENNDISNLCLLCPNCHSQTPTYKGRNFGNGRHYRRVRYSSAKSF